MLCIFKLKINLLTIVTLIKFIIIKIKNFWNTIWWNIRGNTVTIMQNSKSNISDNQKFLDYFNDVPNTTDTVVDTVPVSEQGFVVCIYSTLFAVGAVGNVCVFISLVRSRRRKSRVNLLMTHLVVADLIVIFIVIPLEVSFTIYI